MATRIDIMTLSLDTVESFVEGMESDKYQPSVICKAILCGQDDLLLKRIVEYYHGFSGSKEDFMETLVMKRLRAYFDDPKTKSLHWKLVVNEKMFSKGLISRDDVVHLVGATPLLSTHTLKSPTTLRVNDENVDPSKQKKKRKSASTSQRRPFTMVTRSRSGRAGRILKADNSLNGNLSPKMSLTILKTDFSPKRSPSRKEATKNPSDSIKSPAKKVGTKKRVLKTASTQNGPSSTKKPVKAMKTDGDSTAGSALQRRISVADMTHEEREEFKRRMKWIAPGQY